MRTLLPYALGKIWEFSWENLIRDGAGVKISTVKNKILSGYSTIIEYRNKLRVKNIKYIDKNKSMVFEMTETFFLFSVGNVHPIKRRENLENV